MKVKFIPADLNKPMEFREIDDGDILKSLQTLVGGGYVEDVTLGRFPGVYQFNHNQTQVVPPDGSLHMIVDEDGLLKGLLINYRASALYGTEHHNNAIVGDAALIGMTRDEDGYDWYDYPLEG